MMPTRPPRHARADLRLLLRSRALRVLAVLVWAWLGWHFLAR
ncbi:DUF6186 family protein [Nocardia fusca]|uniref:DUF6186 family protein n=1 Tax=Nocardia fusca TaxID=941183 RepID=A0ABV3FA82_9NOCA